MIAATRYRLTQEIARQSRLADQIAQAQTDLATENRIHRPSDDPAAAARIATLRRAQANEAAWKANAQTGAGMAGRVDTALGNVANAIDRANELMLQARSDTLSASDRATIAAGLRAIAEEVAGYAGETDARGQTLFPQQPLALPIGNGVTVAATPTAEDVFGNPGLGDILTGAAAAIEGGTPTDAALGALAAAGDRVADQRGAHGVRMNRFDAAIERIAASGLTLIEERSALESTDVTETVARLQAKLLTLEAAQAAFARISQQSLFDKLR